MGSGKLCGDGGFTLPLPAVDGAAFWQPEGAADAVLYRVAGDGRAMLLDIQPGDEVIMPSFTFVSTANAFVLRGAKIVFVDLRPDTMNIDETKIEAAITDKTRAIVPVHYAGVACEMDTIMALAKKYNLYVVEDAAQGVMATYKGKALGTIGHIGCFSFHETKNYTAGGEGGATLINDPALIDRAEVIREKGTNRSQFFRGQVDKYTWRDIGSSYLMSDLQAAYLWGQLEAADHINQRRLACGMKYYDSFLASCQTLGAFAIADHSGRTACKMHTCSISSEVILKTVMPLSIIMKEADNHHGVPLHSVARLPGRRNRFGRFSTAKTASPRQESARLVRLPLFYNMSDVTQRTVINTILSNSAPDMSLAKASVGPLAPR
jgi:dTDP-4-amino-4,6-dideoxygalactose transaminase